VVVWIVLGIILWWFGAVITYSVTRRPSKEIDAAVVSMAWYLIVPMVAIVWSIITVGEAVLHLFEGRR